MSRACVLYVSNKVQARYMRVEDALNAFGTRSRNDSVLLRLHYVPGGHGSHVSDNRDQNGINVRQRRGTG